VIHGFKRSFYPGSYTEKRAYVRQVLDECDRVLARFGIDPRAMSGATPIL
jgi:hypothetical protein